MDQMTPEELEIIRLWSVIQKLTQWKGLKMTDREEAVVGAIYEEFARASKKHAPMHSHHEAYGVSAEEFEEYWREVQKGGKTCPRDPAALRTELIETAAMSMRALYDIFGENQ
jgi:hypothetical protein